MGGARIWIALALILAHAVVALWDLACVIRSSPEETISRTLYDWSTAFPILPVIMGIIIGHVFWPMRPLQPIGR